MDWPNLVDRYGARVLLVCRSILRDDGLSRDAAQDAMVKLSKANGSVKDMDAWVVSVAGNTARDYLRRAKRAPEPLVQDRADVRPDPLEGIVARESVERVRAALESLPVGERDVLLLKFREGLSGPDIAKALGVSLEAAWQKVCRALKTLRAKLGANE